MDLETRNWHMLRTLSFISFRNVMFCSQTFPKIPESPKDMQLNKALIPGDQGPV